MRRREFLISLAAAGSIGLIGPARAANEKMVVYQLMRSTAASAVARFDIAGSPPVMSIIGSSYQSVLKSPTIIIDRFA